MLRQQRSLLSVDYYKNAVINEFEKWHEDEIYCNQVLKNVA
jgi:hypothetical protein